MLFIKSGKLHEAIGLARDERMIDGQDPLAIMNGCSEARMNAPVLVEIEVSGGSDARSARPMTEAGETRIATLLAAIPAMPVMLKMYVSVQSPPFRRAHEKEWYLFAKRIDPALGDISHIMAALSEHNLNFVMNVR